jgi:mRNA interferase HigB
VRVVAKRTLREFWKTHPDCERALQTWYLEATKAKWLSPGHVKAGYISASILADSRVVFNICGNRYRLVVKIRYELGLVFVRFVGSHAEYSRVDAESV